jgi:hypothetical protein
VDVVAGRGGTRSGSVKVRRPQLSPERQGWRLVTIVTSDVWERRQRLVVGVHDEPVFELGEGWNAAHAAKVAADPACPADIPRVLR